MILLSIVAGIIGFALFLLALHLIDKAYEVNSLLGMGVIYVVFYFLNDKIAGFLPRSLTVKQITNEFILDNGLGFLLYLDQPQLSAYELTISSLRLCIIGYFIYNFGFKEISWKKIKRSFNKTTQGPNL
nr:hypothetical protein [uncultured Allomuricauda sp.]